MKRKVFFTEKNNYEELTTRIPAKELSMLLKVASSLASTMDLNEVLQIAIESAASLLGLNTGAIYTLENGELYLGATTPPLPAQFPDELRFAKLRDHPHINEVVLTKAPVYLEDARQADLSAAEKIVVEVRQLVSNLFFPLLLKEEVIGVFIVGTTSKIRHFAQNDIDLCHILSFQAALAISNTLLYKKAQQSYVDLSQAYDSTLEGWSRVLDLRDHVTEEHTRRVVELTVTLAGRMGIPNSELGHIRRGALLHDIGKMGIPDSILQKGDALSDDEERIMQTHPELAHQILSQINYLNPVLDIPYAHHEKWDGTGYPRKLKGEEIPLTARIFAVVDVFDALTSDRPYRQAWKKEDALQYLKEQSGIQFDPQTVKAFLELVGE